MHDQHRSNGAKPGLNEGNLVFMMGEELKKPLTVIKALSESSTIGSPITLEARKALRTIDNVLLYQRLASEQTELVLTPVHLGSALTQVAADLQPLSIERGCETEVFIQSGIATVDVDRAALKSGLESLWQAVLSMTERPSPLSWHIFRTSKGIRISITNNSLDLSKVSFASTSSNIGRSRQPIAGIAGPATDLLTAHGIFEMLGSNLAKITREGKSGLAVTLPISAQLALV
ncbi:MAG: hypothetical protein ACI9T8_000535 [Candidatus Saccharimonadales bacterium]|jgi:hypothetical protein